MTIFDTAYAGLFLALYFVGGYMSTMAYMVANDFDSSVTWQTVMVLAILWPYFVVRGFVRALAKGWQELHR